MSFFKSSSASGDRAMVPVTRASSSQERTTQPFGTEAALIPDDRIPLGGTLLRTRLSKELWRMNGVGGYGGELQVKNGIADGGETCEDGI
ncbi:unnamed protein product [Cochlearia groenlandica]